MARTTSYGTCRVCGKRTTKGGMTRHLKTCLPQHDPTAGKRHELCLVRAQDAYSSEYWLCVELLARTPLEQLDRFLRRVWLECCGHMSAFQRRVPGGGRYGWAEDADVDMGTRVASAFPADKTVLAYEYDFGSTTKLSVQLLGRRQGSKPDRAVRLLARNEPPQWSCGVCDKPATRICPFCGYGTDAFLCDAHAPDHECDDPETLLPVVNSPRMGVCGYTGGNE